MQGSSGSRCEPQFLEWEHHRKGPPSSVDSARVCATVRELEVDFTLINRTCFIKSVDLVTDSDMNRWDNALLEKAIVPNRNNPIE